MTNENFSNPSVTPKRKRGKTEEANWAEWVHTHTILFSMEEISEIMSELQDESPNLPLVLTEFADEGLKSTFKYNRRKNQYQLRVFRDNPNVGDAGYAVVVEANSFERCVAGFLYAMRDLQEFNLKMLVSEREAAIPDF